MPDVGILNLQIHDNSSKAVPGLRALAGALDHLKNVVGNGIRMSGVSANIKKIADAVNTNLSGTTFERLSRLAETLNGLNGIGGGVNFGSAATQIRNVARTINENITSETITSLERFAKALSQLQGLGNININIRAAKEISRIAEEIRNTNNEAGNMGNTFNTNLDHVASGISRVNEQFNRLRESIQEVNQLVEQTAFQFGGMEEAFARMFEMWNNMRMARSLMSGNAGLPEGGAIPVEGTVEDPYEKVNDRLIETVKYLEEVGAKTISFINYLDHANSATREVGDSVNAIIPYAEHYGETWEEICQRLHEVTSIKGIIWSGTELGEALRGALGVDAFEEAVRIVSKTTGLSRENIIRQVADELERYRNSLREARDEAKRVAAEQENMGAAGEAVGRGAEHAGEGFADMQDQAQRANPLLDLLREKLEILEWKLEHGKTLNGRLLNEEQLVNLAIQIEKIRAQIQMMESDFNSVGNITGDMVHDLVNNTSQIELMRMRLNDMQRALIEDINLNKLDAQQIAERTLRIQNLREEINRLVEAELRAQLSGNFDMSTVFESTAQAIQAVGTNLPTVNSIMENYQNVLAEVSAKQGDTAGSTGILGRSFDNVKNGIQKMFPTMTGMIKRLGQIAKYRALRYVLRAITSGLSEGIKNVYQYSSAINGHFAAAMDSAASSLLLMKNSLGAAAAPLVEMLIPYLQQVVNWFVNLLNYANQFFALLNGQSSWTRAVPATTKAFGNQEKAAKGASNAIKDLLADWDELNIIQSESGKGAGSGASGSAENYLEMFEEVGKFNNKVRDVVDYIQENIGSILTDVGLISAAILGWKLSGAFAGALGTIGAIAGTVATFAVIFDVSKEFNTKFLDTGKEGYLVADLLTTLIGGLATDALISEVISSAAGTVAFGLTFAISAAAGIIANVAKTDVSTLSRNSIVSSIVSALKVWAAVTAAGKGLFNLGLGEAAGIGGIGALATFAAAISIKADAQTSVEGITEETIAAKIGSLLGVVGASALVAAKTGTGAAGAAGLSMLFGGAEIATYGVAVAIHAINETVDAGEITPEVIRDNLIASGLIGAGLGISSAALVGGTMGTIYGLATGGLALGALFVIEAMIEKQPAKIQWGDYNATKEEIEAFISNDLYSNPPSVTIGTIQASLTSLDTTRSDLESDVSSLLGTLNVLKVGLTPTATDDVKEQINEVVTSFNKTAQQYQNTLQVALTLAPVKNDDGSDASAEIIQNSSERWSELNGIMTQLGSDLADAYKTAYDARLEGNIDEAAEKTIDKISGMMTKVASAIASGQARAKASHAIRTQMENLSKASLGTLLDEYKKQRDQLIEELTKARTEGAEGILAQRYAYEELADYALKEANGDVTDATYQHYKAQAETAEDEYKKAIANMKAEVEAAADNLLDAETAEKLHQAVLGYMDREVTLENWLNSFGGTTSETFAAIQELWSATGQESILNGDMAEQNVFGQIVKFITASFAEGDRANVEKALRTGVAKLSDFVDKATVDALADVLEIPEATRGIWDQYVNKLLGIDGSGTTQPVSEVEVPEVAPVVSGETTVDPQATKEVAEEIVEAVENAINHELIGKAITVGITPIVGLTLQKTALDDVNDLFNKTASLPNFLEEFENGLYELDFKYGSDDVNKALEESGVLKYLEDAMNGTPVNTGKMWNNANTMAFAGYSDSNVGNARTRLSGEETTYTQTADPAGEKQRIQEGVETGVRKGNADQNQLLQQAVNLLLQIARKDFTVNVTPNSSWGRFGSQSNEYYERVGGETVSKW